MLVLLSLLISRLINRSGLRLSHSKVFSSVNIYIHISIFPGHYLSKTSCWLKGFVKYFRLPSTSRVINSYYSVQIVQFWDHSIDVLTFIGYKQSKWTINYEQCHFGSALNMFTSPTDLIVNDLTSEFINVSFVLFHTSCRY